MYRPIVAYLRVYEPLTAFGDPPDERLVKAARTRPLSRVSAGKRERWLWLKSQTGRSARVLPADAPGGAAEASAYGDVLALDPADVPVSGGIEDPVDLGSETLVCPLQMRARSAAALRGFIGETTPALKMTVLQAADTSEDDLRRRSSAAMRQPRNLHARGLHTRCSNWAVPLPWFTLVDPEQRLLVLGNGPDDPNRELSWRSTMTDARRRAARARELLENTVGDTGPAQVLGDTERWLHSFHEDSAVELDYGGLVQVLSDDLLREDTSAEQIQHIQDALGAGDMEELTSLFNDLQRYWTEIASGERVN